MERRETVHWVSNAQRAPVGCYRSSTERDVP